MNPRNEKENLTHRIEIIVVHLRKNVLMAAAHLQTIAHYIQKRRHTVHNTIRSRDVLKECREAERRRGTPPRLFWSEQDMSEPTATEFGTGREGGIHQLLGGGGRTRLAPQARPTITEERPREAMPVSDPALEARWRAAHIND